MATEPIRIIHAVPQHNPILDLRVSIAQFHHLQWDKARLKHQLCLPSSGSGAIIHRQTCELDLARMPCRRWIGLEGFSARRIQYLDAPSFPLE